MTKQEKVAAFMKSHGYHRGSNSIADCWWDETGMHQVTDWLATFFYEVVEEAKQNLLHKFDEQLGTIPSSQEVVKYADHLRGRIDQKLEIREWIAGQLRHLKQKGQSDE